MHISLPIGAHSVLMGSDSNSASGAVIFGQNMSVSINTVSREEADRFFNGLSANGSIVMPMTDTFWGAYFGMCTDKFGVNWMVNYDEVKEE
jgi:PhnB protein